MKICTKCQKSLPETEFHMKGVTRKSWCKMCQKRLHKMHYEANKKHRISRANERNTLIKAKLTELVATAKSGPCLDCDQSFDAVCMDFDHVKGIKKFDISTYMSGNRLSERVLSEELAKCELVCSNCHRKRTASRLRK